MTALMTSVAPQNVVTRFEQSTLPMNLHYFNQDISTIDKDWESTQEKESIIKRAQT